MAISDTQKVDYLFKKVGFGVSKTDTNANKVAPNESIASPLLLRGDRVWKQSGSIPALKPSSSSGVVTVYTGASTVECVADGTASSNRTWLTNETDWIPPEFGSTYLVNVYVHTSGDAANASTGTKLFVTGSGNDDEWFFDYQSGVLNFIGDNLPNGINFAGKSIYVEGAQYTGEFGVGSAGGEDSIIGNLEVTGTTIGTVNSNNDIVLDPNGTGIVIVDTNQALKLPYGDTDQRPASPEEGFIRYNSTTNAVEVYSAGAWVKVGDPDTSAVTVDSFTGDGSTTTFTLSKGNLSTNQVLVTINGVSQHITSYSVSGSTLTLNEVIQLNDKVEARYFVGTTNITALSDSDGDTTVDVETSVDEDIIRFKSNTQQMTINSTGVSVDNLFNLPQYTVSGLPTGSAGSIVYVSDGDGGNPCIAVHNGTNWKIVSLGGTIS